MKENVDYKLIEYIEGENSDHWTVELLSGDFKGVKIQYGTITIDEENDTMNFNYDIVDHNGLDVKEDNVILISSVKTILNNVLTDALDLMESQHENTNNGSTRKR